MYIIQCICIIIIKLYLTVYNYKYQSTKSYFQQIKKSTFYYYYYYLYTILNNIHFYDTYQLIFSPDYTYAYNIGR